MPWVDELIFDVIPWVDELIFGVIPWVDELIFDIVPWVDELIRVKSLFFDGLEGILDNKDFLDFDGDLRDLDADFASSLLRLQFSFLTSAAKVFFFFDFDIGVLVPN